MLADGEKYCVYVDESGTNQLNPDKDQFLFFVAAVIIKESDVQQSEAVMKSISSRFFQGKEVKSQPLHKNPARRLEVLRETETIPFRHIVLIINKSQVDPKSGLRYKPSFYKNGYKRLFKKISLDYQNAVIYTDNLGSDDFRESFDSYWKKQNTGDFFLSFHHNFVDSKESPLVQLADLIAGTVKEIYFNKPLEAQIFASILDRTKVEYYVFPPALNCQQQYGDGTEELMDDIDIYKAIVEKTEMEIEDLENSSDDDEICQRMVLKRLLERIRQKNVDPLYAASLISYLKNNGHPVSDRKFRSDILGGLRNKGIVIAGTPTGYRLAVTKNDVRRYLRHDASVMMPMLYRIKCARKTLTVNTNTRVLDEEEFSELKGIVDAVAEDKLFKALKLKAKEPLKLVAEEQTEYQEQEVENLLPVGVVTVC